MQKCFSSCGIDLAVVDPAACAWMAAFMLLRDYIKSEIHYCINLDHYHHITMLYHLCSYSSSEV